MNEKTIRYQELAAAWQEDPTPQNLQNLEQFMEGFQAFLERNKNEIFSVAQGQGWKRNGPVGSDYVEFFNTAMLSMEHFLQRPSEATLDASFEGLAQLNWLLVNVPPNLKS